MVSNKTKLLIVLIILIVTLSTAVAALKTFTVQETELVKLNVKAEDADNDEIKYYYSPPLDDNGEWQTGYDDAGEYNIKITASDGLSKTEEEVLLIVEDKKKPNHKPELNLDPITVNEGEKIILNLPEKDSDGDKLTYSFEDKFDFFGVWKTNFSDSGNYKIKVSVSDGKFTVKKDVEITVKNVDRIPELTVPESLTFHEGQKLEFKIETSDPDGDEIIVTFKDAPEGAQFNQETKTFSWQPSYDIIKRKDSLFSNILNSLRLEHFFLDSKTFSIEVISCANELCTSRPLSLKVHNVNRAPMFENLLNVTFKETQLAILSPEVKDPDGDIVRVTFSKPLDKKGTWETDNSDEGKYLVYVAATDGKNTTTVPVELNIAKNNREPSLIIRHKKLVVTEGRKFNFKVSAKDPDGDKLIITLEDGPVGSSLENGTFTWEPSYETVRNSGSTWTDNLVSEMTYLNEKLNPEEEIVWLNFKVSDGELESFRKVKIIVKNVNKEPEILDYLPSGTVTAMVGESLIFHVAAKDVDNDPLNYRWTFGLGEQKVLGTDTIERTFSTPGKKKVRVTVSDGPKQKVKEWNVQVLEKEFHEKPVSFSAEDFRIYVVDI